MNEQLVNVYTMMYRRKEVCINMIPVLPYFNPWMLTNPTLPKLYWEVKSPEQLIANVYCIIDAFSNQVNDITGQVNANTEKIAELESLFNKFIESGFEDYYEKQLEQWLNDNVQLLWETFAQMVFFGLTSDGHFCAYVPESWSDITFDTGAVYGTSQYGRLILRYRADGSGVIDNTAPDYETRDLATERG